MSEQYPSDANLNALSGTSDAEQEVLYVATGESPYFTSFYKMLHRLLDVARRGGDLRVYKDGQLTFGVRQGRFLNGDTAVDYAGATGNALMDDATNYIYLTAGGVLTVNQTGFPVASTTPHLPLATIVTANGDWDVLTGITDYRGRCFLQPVGRSNPDLTITAGAENGISERVISFQVSSAQRFRVRLWIGTADFGAPSAAGNTVAITTGAQLRANTANADYELITDATGLAAITVTIAGAANRYFLAEIDGRIYSSGVVAWA